jgi:hypothetical protein
MGGGGFGPTLYMRTPATWAKHLGSYDGHAVHALLLSYRDKPGAVPKKVNIHQGECEVCFSKEKKKDVKKVVDENKREVGDE